MLLEMTLRRNKPSHSIPLSERSLEKKKEGRESGSADEASALAGFKGARSLWYAVFTAHARRAAIRRRRSILEGQILTAAFLSLSSLFYSPTLFLSLVLSLSSLLFSIHPLSPLNVQVHSSLPPRASSALPVAFQLPHGKSIHNKLIGVNFSSTNRTFPRVFVDANWTRHTT